MSKEERTDFHNLLKLVSVKIESRTDKKENDTFIVF